MQDPNPDWPYIDDERYTYPLYKKHPFCYICCNLLSCNPSEYSPGRHAYSKPNAGQISYSAREIDDFYTFTFPGWRTLYRLIMFNPKTRCYRISGIAQNYWPCSTFHAPWNENNGLLSVGKHKRIWRHGLAAPKLIQPKVNIEKQTTLAGYMVHAMCWRELLRVIKWSHTEGNLGILSHALRTRCMKERLDISYDEPVESQLLMDPRDPIGMTSVRRFVTRCRSRATRMSKVSHTSCSTDSWLIRLPLELQYMIMDNLEFDDVGSVLKGIQWSVDNGYWKRRLNLDLFSEIRGILHEDLDWRWLCLKLEVLEHSQAGTDRKRFYEILKEIGIRYGLVKADVQCGLIGSRPHAP
ncbi:hypothetical protein ASPTUDRAFT_28390 [Aspergillus tubingensis CBS 134.48]|uniref:Uncharacterized protein n=1 Tax=Aspergillus tubingensis (strain CBS 134.48) TaxID=767770 RepID=A0A1L9N699_ASPTC|nr:hypothetical protein ASPTUDRAFT_28390 [Aspergillus tubingensis CBS 134.48]